MTKYEKLLATGSLAVVTPTGRRFTIRIVRSRYGAFGYAADDGSRRLVKRDYKMLSPESVENWLDDLTETEL